MWRSTVFDHQPCPLWRSPRCCSLICPMSEWTGSSSTAGWSVSRRIRRCRTWRVPGVARHPAEPTAAMCGGCQTGRARRFFCGNGCRVVQLPGDADRCRLVPELPSTPWPPPARRSEVIDTLDVGTRTSPRLWRSGHATPLRVVDQIEADLHLEGSEPRRDG